MAAKRRRTGGGAILLVALWVAPGVAATASAATPEIGAAELVVSQVRGRLGQITRELAIKDNVYSEEVIETDADAATRIVFLDGTELSMGPSSRMVLDRYVYDPSAGTGEMALRMVTGVFEFASGNIPADGYDLGTPFGNLAIRGTVIAIDIDPGRRAVVGTEEGEVSFRGATITPDTGCFYAVVPGTGTDRFLDFGECQQELAEVEQMTAMLEGPAPGAGPPPEPAAAAAGGVGADRNERPFSPGFAGPGASPR